MRDATASRLLLVALLVSLVLWNIPYGWVALYPFKIFATWLHEGSHALLMIVTGAGLSKFEIFRDTSGLAYQAHSVAAAAQVIIASAGYVGTAFFGACFLVLGRTERGGRAVLLVLSLVMLASVAAGIRNTFGIVAICAEAGVLLLLARWGAERLCAFVVSFLAAQSCINAVLDIRVLFGAIRMVDGQPHAQSDADTVARIIGGPASLWATLWLLWSFALFYAALRLVRPRPIAADVAAASGAIQAAR
jgi:peptidase M50B-like protein